jgi:outer membrane protein assembly factor BamB
MIKRILILCMALLLVTGCESIFGKESGSRGALPGKREDVLSTDRALKPDLDLDNVVIELPQPKEIAEWPFAGGSLSRAHGNATLAAEPDDVWSVSIGDGSTDDNPLVAQPVVANGKIFTVDSEAKVSAFSTEDGKSLWQKELPDPMPEGSPKIGGSGIGYINGTVLVTTSYGHVIALNAENGEVLWQKQLPSPIRSAPVAEEDRVYVTTTTNVLYNLSLADGSIGWSHPGTEEAAALMGQAPPMPQGEIVITPFSSGQVVAVRKLNGGGLWEESLASLTSTEGTLPAMSDIQGPTVLDNNGRIFVASHSGRLVKMDVRSGQRIWETDAGSSEMPWLAGDVLFVLTIENQLAAVSAEDGRVYWVEDLPRYEDNENRTDPILWTGPVLAGSKLWIANSLGKLYSFDPNTGKELNNRSVSSKVYVPLLAVGNTLYVLSDNGRLTAFR